MPANRARPTIGCSATDRERPSPRASPGFPSGRRAPEWQADGRRPPPASRTGAASRRAFRRRCRSASPRAARRAHPIRRDRDGRRGDSRRVPTRGGAGPRDDDPRPPCSAARECLHAGSRPRECRGCPALPPYPDRPGPLPGGRAGRRGGRRAPGSGDVRARTPARRTGRTGRGPTTGTRNRHRRRRAPGRARPRPPPAAPSRCGGPA